jgi:hypothetical protein
MRSKIGVTAQMFCGDCAGTKSRKWLFKNSIRFVRLGENEQYLQTRLKRAQNEINHVHALEGKDHSPLVWLLFLMGMMQMGQELG